MITRTDPVIQFISKQGPVPKSPQAGKRLHTWGVSSVGEILAVSGDTFTSRQGAWIYTWSKDGKKINTRAAK